MLLYPFCPLCPSRLHKKKKKTYPNFLYCCTYLIKLVTVPSRYCCDFFFLHITSHKVTVCHAVWAVV